MASLGCDQCRKVYSYKNYRTELGVLFGRMRFWRIAERVQLCKVLSTKRQACEITATQSPDDHDEIVVFPTEMRCHLTHQAAFTVGLIVSFSSASQSLSSIGSSGLVQSDSYAEDDVSNNHR